MLFLKMQVIFRLRVVRFMIGIKLVFAMHGYIGVEFLISQMSIAPAVRGEEARHFYDFLYPMIDL